MTFCLAPYTGEVCAVVRLALPHDHSTQQLTARHRLTAVETDGDGPVVLTVEITDPATARPVDVRFDIVPEDVEPSWPGRVHEVTRFVRDGSPMTMYGTYLGPVADEN